MGDPERRPPSLAELAVLVRRERDRCRAAGLDTTRLDDLLSELEPLCARAHDAEIARALRPQPGHHSRGPYTAVDIAAHAGLDDVDAVRHVLDQIADAGLATPPDPRTPPEP